MKDHTIVLEHPKLGGYHATVEAHFYGPLCEAHRLMVVDDEGDVVLEVLGRINATELCVRRIRELLLEHGFARPDDDDPLGPLAWGRRSVDRPRRAARVVRV